MSLWGCDCPLPALAACHQRGMVCSWLVIFSPLFCVRAWRCLRLGLAFRVVVIPQSGLLAKVSSLWLHLGHLGPILKKHCSPCLPAQPPLASGGSRHLCCFSTGGVTTGLVICGFELFIYFSSLLCCPLCFQASPQTWQWECFLVFGNFSLFKTPFLGLSSLPTSFISFFVFYIFSYLFSKTMSCFSGCLMSSASIQKLFVILITKYWNVILMNLCGRKWSPHPIPLPS